MIASITNIHITKNKTQSNCYGTHYIDGLVQDCSIYIAKALEILQPCTKPSLWSTTHGSVVVHPFHLHSLFRRHNKHCVGGTRRYHTAFVCKDDSLQMKNSILIMMICAHHVGTQATIVKTPPRFKRINFSHYSDIIMGTMASQSPASRLFTQPFIQGTDQRKHQSSTSLAFVRGIHRCRWIPRTNGQWCGKCVHFMTSWWVKTKFNIPLWFVANSYLKHFSDLFNEISGLNIFITPL